MPVGRDDVDDRPLDQGQLLEGLDVAEAEVVALADVGHDGDVAAVEAEPLAEDAAAGRLQHGRLDRGLSSTARALCGPLQSPVVDPPAVDVDAVGAGHADRLAGAPERCGRSAGWWSSCR